MELIRIDSLVKVYGNHECEVKALDHVSLSVKQGEFIAVMGPSGCGKSTLLHMLGGVDTPTSGTIIIDNQDITKMKKYKLTLFRRKYISIVYQFYNLLPTLNVVENIVLPLKLAHRKIDRNKVEELLKQFHLEDRKEYMPNQLSGGQQQRTAFLRAIMSSTPLILCDEPTGNLDKENSLNMMKYIKDIHKHTNTTIILVTHDAWVASYADRIITMEDGKIIGNEVTSYEKQN